MSSIPPDLAPFFSFFRLSAPTSPDHLPEVLARVHGYVLLVLRQIRHPDLLEQFWEDSGSGEAYWRLLGPAESTQDRMTLFFDSLKSTLGKNYRLTVDPSQHVILSLDTTVKDLFPLFLAGTDGVCWFAGCRSGAFLFQNSTGNSFSVNISHPLFEDLIGGFMERGWYRPVLRVLEKIDEKSFENRKYSAHCLLACEYYKGKHYEEAIKEFEEAMKIRSDIPQLFYNLALSYGRNQSYKTAIRLLNHLNRIRPGQAKTFELLGDFYFHLAEWERSMLMYRNAFDLSQDRSTVAEKIRRLESRLPKVRQSDARKEKEEEKEERFSVQNCIVDLTVEAELGRFQPALGRERELMQMQEILSCHSKKNVLVLGDPGVGKTALVQELAYKMVAGTVNTKLQDKKLLRINMGSLLAGAKFRGQFEERLMQLIRDVKKTDSILFVDDIHQIVAGGSAKTASMEATHFFKPALMNDEIQLIGATNFDEFRNSVEKDSSFLRCFQIVRLEEPDDETVLKILQAYRSVLENHHGVRIPDEALETALTWVRVLLRERALPDKVLDLLDRAAARVSVQEEPPVVTSEKVLETISEISNIPVSRMSVSETAHYRNSESFLSRRVIGQSQAIHTVSKVLWSSKLRMNLNPSRPKGIFLFVGPTGVGKTELARAMAQFLFGHEDKIIRIDMSEYMERYSASRLIGTSPGYVGYYDQNQLVDKIRANPYSLILLDEIEKADSQLLNIFLQVFDAGRLTDGKGKIAYFDNATIVMTSNLGTHLFAQNRLGYGADQPDSHVTRSDLMKEVKRFFQPEFLNRIDEIVFFQPLAVQDVRQIAELKLCSIYELLRSQNKKLVIQEPAMLELCKIGYDYEYGARNLERTLRRHLLDKLAGMALKEDWPLVRSVTVDREEEDFVLRGTYSPGLEEVLQTTVEEQDYLEE